MTDGFDGDSTHFHVGVGEAVDPRHALQRVVVRGHDLAPEDSVELREGQVHVIVPMERLAVIKVGEYLLDRGVVQNRLQVIDVELLTLLLVVVDDQSAKEGRILGEDLDLGRAALGHAQRLSRRRE